MLLTSVSWKSSPGERPQVSQARPLTVSACTVAPVAPTCPVAASDGQRPVRSGEAGPGVWRSERDPASPPPHLGADPLGRSLCAWSRGGGEHRGLPGTAAIPVPRGLLRPSWFQQVPALDSSQFPAPGPPGWRRLPTRPCLRGWRPPAWRQSPQRPSQEERGQYDQEGTQPQAWMAGSGRDHP